MILEKYSMGIGDRFAHQGKSQLQAFIQAKNLGIDVVPVWNKSYREHNIINSSPRDVLIEAQNAIKELNWPDSFYVDADHIGLDNVDQFIESSSFFTIDVADFTGKKANADAIDDFIKRNRQYIGHFSIPGIEEELTIDQDHIRMIAHKYLLAIEKAGQIYQHIAKIKGQDRFITEVSMDETDSPQSPMELFFILSAISRQNIPAQTIAPKFTGRFNKGVDYVGDLKQFEKELRQDIAIIAFAIKEFNLPDNLKLSIHSGSDKFSLYPIINKALQYYNSGIHVKTAGTTWLEELIGLAMAEGQGLTLAKEIYQKSFEQYDKLSQPYLSVLDVNVKQLPSVNEVKSWDGERFANTLRHDQNNPHYNRHFRQLLHVGYKVAADMKPRFFEALEQFEQIIAQNVSENILERHLRPIFHQLGA